MHSNAKCRNQLGLPREAMRTAGSEPQPVAGCSWLAGACDCHRRVSGCQVRVWYN